MYFLYPCNGFEMVLYYCVDSILSVLLSLLNGSVFLSRLFVILRKVHVDFPTKKLTIGYFAYNSAEQDCVR